MRLREPPKDRERNTHKHRNSPSQQHNYVRLIAVLLASPTHLFHILILPPQVGRVEVFDVKHKLFIRSITKPNVPSSTAKPGLTSTAGPKKPQGLRGAKGPSPRSKSWNSLTAAAKSASCSCASSGRTHCSSRKSSIDVIATAMRWTSCVILERCLGE